jgi:hypothetical protein
MMKLWRWSSIFAALAATCLTAAAACAVTGSGQPAPAGSTGASPATSATPAVTPEPVGGSGSPVPIVAGKVTVKVGAASYQAGAVVTATVANGLDRAIYTEDFKTVCSIFILQRSEVGVWTDITGCKLGRPTLTVIVGPGLGRSAQLDPNSFHLTGGRTGPAFGAGTYRVKFTYRLDPEVGGEDPLVAYSAEFAIR